MFVNRTRGVVWATAGVLSLVGCTDPEQKTDLRPAGPPEVLSVLVMNDAAGGLYEGATFCKPGDDKRPSQVGTPDGNLLQVCPADQSMGVDELADANPQNWYVRIMFDELLDPSIEELSPIIDSDGNDTGTFSGSIANTKPVKLQCQSISGNGLVDVPYDGYYSPSGNNVTWPLGPSIVVKPNFPALVATDTECQITVNSNVTDKDGNPVPDNEIGPYKFKIAPVALVTADTSPADGDMVDAIAAGVDVTFNTFIDPTSLVAPLDPPDGTESFDFTPHETDTYVFDESSITGLPEFFLGADFKVSTMYTFAFKDGTKIKDQCGKETTFGPPSVADGTQVSFTTNDLAFNGIAPFDGQMNVKPKDKIQLKFNQYMDPSTLATTEWSLSPAVTGATASYNSGLTTIVDAELAPSTMYTFTLKNGATIDDCPGGEFAFGFCPPTSGTFTNSDGDQVVHFTTAALALSGTTPADNGTFTLNGTTNTLKIDIAFNFDANPASLAASEYTFSAAGVTFTASNPATGLGVPAKTKSTIRLTSTAAVPPGDYTFTLKDGATVDDFETTPATYTQSGDIVIHFTVAAAPTPPTPTPCY
jgi:hypothetical protein